MATNMAAADANSEPAPYPRRVGAWYTQLG